MWTSMATCSMVLVLAAGPSGTNVQDAVDRLVQCVGTRDARCAHAASTLVAAGAKAVSPILLEFDAMPRGGKLLALGTLGQIQSRKATTGLLNLATDDELDVGMRTLAIATASDRFGDKRANKAINKVLIKLVQDEDPVIRATAARSLGNRSTSTDRKILKALEGAARDKDGMVRVEAVLGLGMSAAPSTGPTLLEALEDVEPRVRMAAADAFTFVRFPPSVVALIETLKSEDGLLRRVAGEALAHQTGEQYGDDYALWREWYAQR